jgi:hypothetical protein
MKKVYLDQCENEGRMAIIVKDVEAVPAGTTIYSMRARDRNATYQEYADAYDLRFIFDDDLPEVNFYAVPQVDIFAKDSVGGLFGTVGQTTDINDAAPICYINNSKECFSVADSLKAFLQMLASGCDWKATMRPDHDIIFFRSKADAEHRFEFIDVRREFPDIDF